MSEREYRTWTAQRIEIVFAACAATGDRGSVREHEIARRCNSWREKLLEGGKAALAGKEERTGEKELRADTGK